MKKYLVLGTSCIMLLAFLMASIGSASAASLPAPMATPISGDTAFSTKVVSVSKLTGITTTSSGLIVPVGYLLGEKQFEGDALVLAGLDYGSVNLCFPVAAVNQGWGGKVGFWTGSAWKLLETTITTPAESSLSWGCAKVYQNGTYAFLKWVVDSSLLPKEFVEINKPACDFEVEMVVLDSTSSSYVDDHFHMPGGKFFYIMSNENLSGKHVKVTFITSEPVGTYLISGKTGNVLVTDGMLSLIDTDIYEVPTVQSLTSDRYTTNETITYKLDFGSCQIISTAPMGF